MGTDADTVKSALQLAAALATLVVLLVKQRRRRRRNKAKRNAIVYVLWPTHAPGDEGERK